MLDTLKIQVEYNDLIFQSYFLLVVRKYTMKIGLYYKERNKKILVELGCNLLNCMLRALNINVTLVRLTTFEKFDML